ncbi:MAG TPA: hypothetical protein ENO02_10215 [Epsilonproteobacteria bacterium]|nr:hypothetical protein [Campylobacterota bacterium]
MAKIRLKKKKAKYATVSRELLANPNISLKAKGMGAWLELHEDGFELNFEFILKNMKEGRDAVRKTIKELKDEDFLVTIQTRGNNGQFETTWIFDSEGEVTNALIPTTENPYPEFQESENHISEKPTQIRKHNKKSKKKISLSSERENFLTNFDSFVSHIRANFKHKTIAISNDKYTDKVIEISVSDGGLLYDKKTSLDFQGSRAKELWNSLYKAALDGKLNLFEEETA